MTDTYSLEAAVKHACKLIGIEELASRLGVSSGLIYQWGNPNQKTRPSFEQMARIDHICRLEHGDAPFAFNLVGLGKQGAEPEGDCLIGLSLTAHESLGHFTTVVRASLADDRITPCEHFTNSRAGEDVVRAVHQVLAGSRRMAGINCPVTV